MFSIVENDFFTLFKVIWMWFTSEVGKFITFLVSSFLRMLCIKNYWKWFVFWRSY